MKEQLDRKLNKNEKPESVKRGIKFLNEKLKVAGESVIKHLSTDRKGDFGNLTILSILAASGAFYLFMRREPGGLEEIKILEDSVKDFLKDIPSMLKSLKDGDFPEWTLQRRVGFLDTTTLLMTLISFGGAIRESVLLISDKIKRIKKLKEARKKYE